MPLELEVYSRTDPTQKVDILPHATAHKFLEERGGVGGGSFTIRADDPRAEDPKVITERNIVKCKVSGKVKFGMLIDNIDPVYIASGEAQSEVINVSGNGLKDWLRDAVLHAENGSGVSSFKTRTFNFASNAKVTGTTTGWYDEVSWTRPWHVAKYGNQVGNPYRYKPAEWPDAPDSYWMWANRDEEAGVGFCYFRTEILAIPKDIGKYSLYVAADDYFEVFIDGQHVATEVESSKTFEQTHRYEFEINEVGIHVIGIKVQNIRGRGALLATVFKEGDTKTKTPARLVTPSKTDAWWIARFPEIPPNWTVGEIWIQLLKEAESRGVRFAQYVKPGFTDKLDSNGKLWRRDLEWTFNIGDNYLTIAEKMEELEVDIWIDPEDYTLHAAQSRGVDRTVESDTVQPILLRKGRDLLGASQQTKWDVKNTLLVDTNTRRIRVEDPVSVAKYGRIEDILSVDADGTLSKIIADKVVTQTSNPSQSASYEIVPREGTVPLEDYQVGDWIMAPGGDGPRTRRRIESISVAVSNDNNSIKYGIEFDTVLKTKQERLERWMTNTLNGSLGGKVSSATNIARQYQLAMSGTGTTGFKVPAVPPAVPAIQSVTLTPYTSSVGDVKVSANLSWDPVTVTEEGQEADHVEYEVWGINSSTSNETNPSKYLMAKSSTPDVVVNQLDPSTSYEMYVVAVGTNGAVSDPSEIMEVYTGDPVEENITIPSAPIVTSKTATLTVQWDGQMQGGQPIPANVQFIRVYVSDTPGGPYSLVGAPISVSGGGGVITVSDVMVGSVYYVVLASQTKYGTISPFSAQSEAVVSAVDEGDLTSDVVGKIQDSRLAADAAAEAAANAQTTANGKNARRRGQTEPPPPPGGWVPGDEWIVDNANGVPVEVRVWNGTAFVRSQLLADEILILSPNGTIQLGNGVVNTPNLVATAIDGMTITGAVIRTDASGQRIQLDSQGLRSFNSSNTQTAALSAATGGLRLNGTLETVSGNSTLRLTNGGLHTFVTDPISGLSSVTLTLAESRLQSPGSNSDFVVEKWSSSPGVGLVLTAGSAASSTASLRLEGATKTAYLSGDLSITHPDYTHTAEIYLGSSGVGIDSSGVIVLNGDVRKPKSQTILWTGSWYLTDSQTIPLPAALSTMENGIILRWSAYSNGAAGNWDWYETYISKNWFTDHGTQFMKEALISGAGSGTTSVATKEFQFLSQTQIRGHARNSQGVSGNFVIREVVSW